MYTFSPSIDFWHISLHYKLSPTSRIYISLPPLSLLDLPISALKPSPIGVWPNNSRLRATQESSTLPKQLWLCSTKHRPEHLFRTPASIIRHDTGWDVVVPGAKLSTRTKLHDYQDQILRGRRIIESGTVSWLDYQDWYYQHVRLRRLE